MWYNDNARTSYQWQIVNKFISSLLHNSKDNWTNTGRDKKNVYRKTKHLKWLSVIKCFEFFDLSDMFQQLVFETEWNKWQTFRWTLQNDLARTFLLSILKHSSVIQFEILSNSIVLWYTWNKNHISSEYLNRSMNSWSSSKS